MEAVLRDFERGYDKSLIKMVKPINKVINQPDPALVNSKQTSG